MAPPACFYQIGDSVSQSVVAARCFDHKKELEYQNEMSFAANATCQNVLQSAKKNPGLKPNSSVLCKPLEIGIVTRLGKCIASRPFG